ncbi:hypothetical protein KC717_01145 [Candidatus Dojkabacteria bacterium]|uniref:ATP-grasp domain-containing protein n=1 Tax=Candidatus Dojkabacteria bacterium TaxID=2099670 RepID=A0A955L779_9BACT|nr:hypothetical protein [Candidatus Dojkabacteria bacterium]
MKNLFLLECQSDITLALVHESAEKRGIVSHYYNYESLVSDLEGLKNLPITEETIVFMAIPFTANSIESQFQPVYEIIRELYSPQKLVNATMLAQNFLKLEDKLYQTYLLQNLDMPHAEVVNIHESTDVDFPIIARKRISSRSKNNFIIPPASQDEFAYEAFMGSYDPNLYIFQKFHELEKDFRVYVLGDEVIQVVEREVFIGSHNKVSVKVKASGELPSTVKDESVKIAHEIGADFVGIDVGLSKDGTYFFIEYNGRAQINAAQNKLGLQISDKIVDYLV